MTIRKELQLQLQLLLICSASLLSTYTFADKPAQRSAESAERTQAATEYREKAAHNARIQEHRALAEGKRAKISRDDDSSEDDSSEDDSSEDDSSEDDNEDAEEQQE